MNISLSLIRILFVLMCILFATTYTTSALNGFDLINALLGIAAGLISGLILIGIEKMFRFNIRELNIATLGLFFGYLLGKAIVAIFSTVLVLAKLSINPQVEVLSEAAIFLFCTYLGMVLTSRASEELYVSIPFIRLKPTTHKKKEVLLDGSILMDPRIIDLASSGLLDHNLILPRFMLKEFQAMADANDEATKAKGRRCLEVTKKLETIPTLDMKYVDTDFPDLKDTMGKLIKLARHLDANILTADISRIQQGASADGIRIINIHSLSNALKPLTQTGEYLNVKIQRYGKEARQGVGYLEDGTMVVVNGGAEFIGDTIRAQVLSVKHTSSGRMIFCNATDDQMSEHEVMQTVANMENSHKNYFAV
jgi:uncharacterized protein YacL